MDKDRIHQIIDWFAGSGLQRLELSEGDATLRLERPSGVAASTAPVTATTGAGTTTAAGAPAPAPATSAAPDAAPQETPVTAPLYGICYLGSAPDAPPFVSVGQAVRAGDTVCIVEAMKVLNAIPAPRDGTVARIEASDGTEVEEGQLLVVLA